MGQICSKNAIKKADMNIPMTVNRTYNGIDEEEQLPLRSIKLEEDSRHLTFDKGGSCNIVGNGSYLTCTQFEDGAAIVEGDDEYEKMLGMSTIGSELNRILRESFPNDSIQELLQKLQILFRFYVDDNIDLTRKLVNLLVKGLTENELITLSYKNYYYHCYVDNFIERLQADLALFPEHEDDGPTSDTKNHLIKKYMDRKFFDKDYGFVDEFFACLPVFRRLYIEGAHSELLREVMCKFVELKAEGKTEDQIIEACKKDESSFWFDVCKHVECRVKNHFKFLQWKGKSNAEIESTLNLRYPHLDDFDKKSEIKEFLRNERYLSLLFKNPAYQRKVKLDLDLAKGGVCTDPSLCSHRLYYNKWDGVLICWDCKQKLNDSEENKAKYSDIIAQEEQREIETPEDDIPPGLKDEEMFSYVGKKSQQRGVKIGFFYELVKQYDLWDWNVWDIIRFIIKPLTEKTRCRFVELPFMQEHVGPASTFISYAQASNIGDVVAAIVDGGADLERCVWFDAFAVRQWPSKRPDLDFASTILHCTSFITVVPSFLEYKHLNDLHEVEFDMRRKTPFLRVWCLVEAHQALKMPDIAYIMKCGSYVKVQELVESGEVKVENGKVEFHNSTMFGEPKFIEFFEDPFTTERLISSVSIESADATVESDKERILNDIRNGVGVAAMNKCIKNAIWIIASSAMDRNFRLSVVQSAACGDEYALQLAFSDPTATLTAALLGFKSLLKKLLQIHSSSLSVIRSTYYGDYLCTISILDEALIGASTGGFLDCMKMLVDFGANVLAFTEGAQDMTPLIAATSHGHYDCVKFLLEKDSSNINACIERSSNFYSALDIALERDFQDIVELLRYYGAESAD